MRASYDDVADAYGAWFADRPLLDDPVMIELMGDVAGRRVCDLACGEGRGARWLAAQGARVVALDVSADLLALARRRERDEHRGIAYVRADAQGADALAAETFDAVMCNMALMDVPALEPTVRGAARMLRPGGRLVLSVTHPCFKAPRAGELVDHADGSWRRTVGGYFQEGRWERPGRDGAWLPRVAYHRTISTYVNALADAGLVLERLREVPVADQSPVWREVPQVLYMRCRKPDRR